MVAFGLISAVIAGVASPTISIILGEIVAIFDPRSTPDAI
jgi:hypothetical protein